MREEVALKINLPESRVQVSIKHTTGYDVNKLELEVSMELYLALRPNFVAYIFNFWSFIFTNLLL
jgi:hypothetical protein